MFSKLLNDTEGFNKLLNQLKKEENEENKNFEKNNYKFKNEMNGEDKITKKPYVNKMNSKRIIDEEKEVENESDSEDNLNKKNNNKDKYDDFNFDFNEKKNNVKEKDKDDDFNYLFNSDKKGNPRNFGLNDNFRKDAAAKKKDEYDYLFNEKKSKEDEYDNLFKKNNEKDFSNIDSEINKILSKDMSLKNNNNNNFGRRNNFNNFNSNNNFNNNDFSSNILKYKSQKISHNNNINGLELEKPYEISNLKPVGGRRPGAGLKAIGYEPNRKSIFDDLNFGGGFGLNKKKETNNNKYGYGYKKDLGPVIMKEKKNDNFYGFNNREDKYGASNIGNNNNYYGKKDKFSLYEKNNQLFNQFNNDIIGNSRRKRNFYSSPNNLGWEF